MFIPPFSVKHNALAIKKGGSQHVAPFCKILAFIYILVVISILVTFRSLLISPFSVKHNALAIKKESSQRSLYHKILVFRLFSINGQAS